MRKVADSTVRRLSLYLRFLDDFEGQGVETVSSEALAQRGGTTSAQVRKDLSFFGSFGKRGLGYYVPELAQRLRDQPVEFVVEGVMQASDGWTAHSVDDRTLLVLRL
jgi:NADH/NAD ratio-sensing transcriptional regulator Rex